MNNQDNGTSGGDIPKVNVPRDASVYKVGCLKFVKRKAWKYRTKQDFQQPLEDYDIKIPSGKCSRSCSNLDSLITLKVASAECGSKERPVDEIVIKKGYAWDGASGPTFDTPASFEASLVHDALYQCMRLGYVTQDSREGVDQLFRHMLGDMGPVRRGLWYWAVRLFGRKSATPEPHKKSRCPGIIAASLGFVWLVHWLSSKCWPAQTADLLHSLRWLSGSTWMHSLVSLLELGLGLLGVFTVACLGAELIFWTFRPCSRKQKGRKYPGFVTSGVVTMGVAGLVLCKWNCWPALTGILGEALEVLGAGTLVWVGIELCIGDSCSLKVCKCPTACENDSQETLN